MSLLWQISGMEEFPGADEAVAPALRELLVENARLFLVAGGTLSLGDWDLLDQAERAAFVAAGRAVAVEQAVRIGKAGQGPLGALRVQAEIDGGEAHDAARLEQAVMGIVRESEASHGS